MAVTVRGRLLRTRLLGRPLLAQSLSLSPFPTPPSPPRILLCPVESYDFSLVVPLRFSLIISLPNFLPRYRFDALPFYYYSETVYPFPLYE